jgi:hypothetical protein
MNEVSQSATHTKRCVLLGGTGRSQILYVVTGSTAAHLERKAKWGMRGALSSSPPSPASQQLQPALLLPQRASTKLGKSPMSCFG